MTPDKAGGTPRTGEEDKDLLEHMEAEDMAQPPILTPRTDAAIFTYEQQYKDGYTTESAVDPDFARTLELALQERTAERDYCMTKGEQWEQRASTVSQQLLSVRAATIEECARVCETFPLMLDAHKYPSIEERSLIAIVEAGCRGAFYEAIFALVLPPNMGASEMDDQRGFSGEDLLSDLKLAEFCLSDKPYGERDILCDIQQLARAVINATNPPVVREELFDVTGAIAYLSKYARAAGVDKSIREQANNIMSDLMTFKTERDAKEQK